MTISSREENWWVGIRERSLGAAGWSKDSRRPGWDPGSFHGGQTDLERLFLEGLAGPETLGGGGGVCHPVQGPEEVSWSSGSGNGGKQVALRREEP